MKIFAFAFFLLIISCGQNDPAKLHADSIEQQLISLPVAENELQYLVDSSQWIFKARLVEIGMFVMWDFGTSEGTHYLRIDSCYKGIDTGIVAVHQRIKDDYKVKAEDDSGEKMVPGDKFILFLKSRTTQPAPKKIAASPGPDSIVFFDKFPGSKMYQLTSDSTGIISWSADIEIRINQMIKAKQKH